MVEGQRKIVVLAAVFLGGLLAGIALILFFQAKPAVAPDTSTLKDLLHNTAQKEIGLPPLADVEERTGEGKGKNTCCEACWDC